MYLMLAAVVSFLYTASNDDEESERWRVAALRDHSAVFRLPTIRISLTKPLDLPNLCTEAGAWYHTICTTTKTCE